MDSDIDINSNSDKDININLDNYNDINIMDDLVMDDIVMGKNKMVVNAIYKLNKEIIRYQQDIEIIWNTHVRNFAMSSDCVTLKLSPDYYEHRNQFIDFMMAQSTYQTMVSTMNKLQQRMTSN
jgi:hypothetical protein